MQGKPGVGKPGRTGVPQAVTRQVGRTDIDDELVPVRCIPHRRGREGAARRSLRFFVALVIRAPFPGRSGAGSRRGSYRTVRRRFAGQHHEAGVRLMRGDAGSGDSVQRRLVWDRVRPRAHAPSAGCSRKALRLRLRLARILAGLIVSSPSRTPSSRNLTIGAIVFLVVDAPDLFSHSSMVRSIVPAVIWHPGRHPSAGSNRSFRSKRACRLSRSAVHRAACNRARRYGLYAADVSFGVHPRRLVSRHTVDR